MELDPEDGWSLPGGEGRGQLKGVKRPGRFGGSHILHSWSRKYVKATGRRAAKGGEEGSAPC